MSQSCPHCTGAMASSRMPGDPLGRVQTCVRCGRSFSGIACEVSDCSVDAIRLCRECGRYVCKRHAGGELHCSRCHRELRSRARKADSDRRESMRRRHAAVLTDGGRGPWWDR